MQNSSVVLCCDPLECSLYTVDPPMKIEKLDKIQIMVNEKYQKISYI